MSDDTIITSPEIVDLRRRVVRLESGQDEHQARLAALEARFSAIEARLQKQHVVLAELQADQHVGFKSMREMLGEVLLAVGVTK
jgi:septal ring factor EnvC (AmiA/AmiB activator)